MTADSAVAAADAAPERGYENLADLEAVVSVKSEATSEEAFSDAGQIPDTTYVSAVEALVIMLVERRRAL